MASEAILVLGLALAKCSVIFLVRRIASASSLVCDAFLGLSVLGGLASLLLITVRCSPSHIIGVDGFCEQQVSHHMSDFQSLADDSSSSFAGKSSP